MKIGFLTACLWRVPFTELVPWAAQQGFQALEISCRPLPPGSDFEGAVIDLNSFDKGKAAALKELCEAHGIEISCLTYTPNTLAADPEERAANLAGVRKAIDAAALLGVSNVSSFIGRDPTKNLADNIEEAVRVFPSVVEYAGERGVRLAIENCPMPDWQVEGLAGNIAYSPVVWDELFGRIEGENFGLNLDPSHLYWLGIDYLQVVRDYADRIFHVHAKDTEIMPEKLARVGNIVSSHGVWWRYRIPGLGEINWSKFISLLIEHGYDYVLSIEHEDPVWSSPGMWRAAPDAPFDDTRIRKGLQLGYRYLSQFVI